MENLKTLNHNFATIGHGALLIWWGIAIMIDPLTMGIAAIGTGLIMLGVNAARLLNGIPTKSSTTTIGVVVLAWGIFDTVFNLSFELSFAMMLIIIGLVTLASLLTHPRAE